MTLNVVVAGGGTAGHIEPAMAVAEELRDRSHNVIALGTARGLETDIVPARGFELKLIKPVPVPRKPSVELLKLPAKLASTIKETKEILAEHNTDVLIGFGGYVSAPAYLAARVLGIPFFVHEANARAGMANKLGVALGGIGLNSVADSGLKGEIVGIPLRKTLYGNQEQLAARAKDLWKLDDGRKTILITGGSQGAQSVNKAVAGAVDQLTDAGYQIIHAYGKKNQAPHAKAFYHPVPYIEDMGAAYAVADLYVGRSGAMTVAETTAANVPAIYVPLPHGNGEQGLNAKSIVNAGGAEIVNDHDLNPVLLVEKVTDILENKHQTMADATKLSGLGNAAVVIANKLEEAARK